MGDLSIELPEIRKLVVARHKAYIGKFGKALSLVEGESELNRTRILAKLKLLSKVLVSSGAVDDAVQMAVSSREGTYPYSIKLGKSNNPICLYLLNTGKDVILSDSVGLALSLGTMEARILLVTDTKRVCKRFVDVLSNDFEWKGMAVSVLDAIHETIYDRHEVLRKELLGELTLDDHVVKAKKE